MNDLFGRRAAGATITTMALATALAVAPAALAAGDQHGRDHTPPGQAKKQDGHTAASQQQAPPAHAPAHGVRGTKEKSKHTPAKSRDKQKSQHKPSDKPQHSEPSRGNSSVAHEKVTFCHATGSASNPYVLITTAKPAVINAHSRHQDGRDIIPAPAGGCPTGEREDSTTPPPTTTPTTPESGAPNTSRPTTDEPAPAPVQATADSTTPAGSAGLVDAVAPTEPQSGVLGAVDFGEEPVAAAPRTVAETLGEADDGSLPFTGLQLLFIVIAGAAALLGGVAMRRAAAQRA